MTRKLLALAAGTLAVLLISSTFDAADAKSRGGWSGGKGYGGGYARSYGGGGSYRSYSFAGPRIHHHRHFRRGLAVGVPLAAYGAYYYGSGCEWLHRRAIYTGSGYWWNRYYACLDGYY
jgi:hypothetical protein